MCVRLSFECREEAAALLTDCGYAFINKIALWCHLSVCMSACQSWSEATGSVSELRACLQTSAAEVVLTQPDLLHVIHHSPCPTCGGVTASKWFSDLWLLVKNGLANISNMLMGFPDQPSMVQTDNWNFLPPLYLIRYVQTFIVLIVSWLIYFFTNGWIY